MNILITGVGATPAICAAESLKLKLKKNVFIIGTDSNPYAVGLYLKKYIDYSLTVPHANNSSNLYIAAIKKIIEDQNVNYILPSTDVEIGILKKSEDVLKPAIVLASDLDTLEICTDKWLTYKALRSHDLMVESWIDPQEVSFPCIIKPRKSQGSKDIYVASNKREFDVYRRLVHEPVFQKKLDAEEYTIDCIFNLNGELIGAVPRRRIIVGGGTAIITETVHNDNLIDIVKRLSQRIKFKGQINVQCIDGKIIEINPRVGGASILSTFSGINMPALSLALWQGKRVEKWYYYEDKILTRYFSSVCINKKDLKRL